MKNEIQIILDFARDTLGADIYGTTIDFRQGCLVEVSISNGYVKLDGGITGVVEYYATSEEAIKSLS